MAKQTFEMTFAGRPLVVEVGQVACLATCPTSTTSGRPAKGISKVCLAMFDPAFYP